MTSASTRDDVLDAALALADEVGWRNITAQAIGARLGGGHGLVIAHYRDLDAIADAWFHRALADTLAGPVDAALPFGERLAHVFGRWLDALAPHRQVSLDMIQAKLYPSHPHHWVPLVFSLSRLVQWMLDAAACEATGHRRQATEIAVSALVPVALWRWKRGDDEAVKAFVAERLQRMERRLDRIFRVPSPTSYAGEVGATRSVVAWVGASEARGFLRLHRFRPRYARPTPSLPRVRRGRGGTKATASTPPTAL